MSSNYFIGGLEPSDDNKEETIIVGGTTYIVSDKFKAMLRDSIIDWGTFLEVYHDNMEYRIMFDQIIKLLNIKENSTLHDMMLPLVRKIYHLPAHAHLSSMMKQFMMYEPVSIVIHSIFNVIKHHYEFVVEQFVRVRNQYIKKQKNAKNAKNAKLNDWKKLLKQWDEANEVNELDSSSIILLFLNPPKGLLKSKLHISIPGVNVKPLKNAIKKFAYPGFCPKVPHKRLAKLLQFPINQFVRVINQMDPKVKFPNYQKVETQMLDILKKIKSKPNIPEIKGRETPPVDLVKMAKLGLPSEKLSDDQSRARLNLAKWYVRKILEFRKNLVLTGKAYEKYYQQTAEQLNKIHIMLKRHLYSDQL